MATLTAKLTLSSSNISSDSLNVTVTNTVSTTTPSVGLSRVAITTSDNQELVDEGTSGVFYFYFKNLDPTNFVILQTTASVQYARVGPGEFTFFPLAPSDGSDGGTEVGGLKVTAGSAEVQINYGFWKRS